MLKYGICFYITPVFKIILLSHLTQFIFFSYPTIFSSVPTPVINNDRSHTEDYYQFDGVLFIPLNNFFFKNMCIPRNVVVLNI